MRFCKRMGFSCEAVRRVTTKRFVRNVRQHAKKRRIGALACGLAQQILFGIVTIVVGGGAEMLKESHAAILEKRGLDIELLVDLGVESSARLGGDCIAIPYRRAGKIVNTKYRTISGEKRFAQEKNGEKCFWNVDVLDDDTLTGPLIITEGEFDAVAAMQAGYQRVVSVPDGAPCQEVNDGSVKYSYLDGINFKRFEEILIASDNDEPGRNLLHDLSERLGKPRCKWLKYPKDCKDFNDALARYGPKGVQEPIRRAQWMKVDGIYRMSELPPEPDRTAYDIGIAGLQQRYKIRLGDFAVVTGIPSHGKSTFVNDVCCHLALKYNWTIAMASFEQHPQIDHKRNLRRWFNRKPPDLQTAEQLAEADDWIDKNFSFIVPGEDDDVTLEWALKTCSASIIQHHAKVVVIDPWNEMDHDRPRDMSLTEYTGFAIKQFRKLARRYGVHVIVVAHPVKMQRSKDHGELLVPSPYDISDSAHWYNKSDIALVVHRFVGEQSMVRVSKSRYHDIIGTPGDVGMQFNNYTGRYSVTDGVQW